MYRTGIAGVDNIIKGFPEGTLLVITGEPGTGKTTLATKIMYTNIIERGSKALYISVAETCEKFFTYMRVLGVDLEELHRSGRFVFEYLEAVKGQETVIYISKMIKEYLLDKKYDIVVVDSITSLLEWLTEAEARNFLHASLYEVSSSSHGLLILIEDIRSDSPGPSILEYVADAVIELKTRTINGLLVRSIVFKKIRGQRVLLGEIPFSITEKELISAYTPPLLENIPAIITAEKMRVPCSQVDDALGGIHRGSQVFLLYPTASNTPDPYYALPLILAAQYGLKIMIVSYDIPANAMICRMEELARDMGFPSDIIEKHIVTHISLNPTLSTMSELQSRLLSMVTTYKPDILILRGIRLLRDLKHHENVHWFLYNITLQLRSLGITTFYYFKLNYPREDDPTIYYGDIVISYEPVFTDNGVKERYIVWKSFRRKISIVDDEILNACIDEIRRINETSASGELRTG